ncbi:MAG: hypothetical protein H8D56_06845 [Planctomycetes bacterium]|nr:hypothetical protein [Planctomycetota bacterium]MBL7144515.1 hypothetical protein [Phycisphaerae bacterium]
MMNIRFQIEGMGDLTFLLPGWKASTHTPRTSSGQQEVPYRHVDIRRHEVIKISANRR